MIDDHDVREMLQRRADGVPATPVDTPKAVRRARRRIVLNGAVATVAAAAIAVTAFASVDAIRSAPLPAVRPTPSPSMPDPTPDVNGGALAMPYEFLDGEVTFAAAPPWDWYVGGWGFTPTMSTLQLDDPDEQRLDQLLVVVADPFPVADGCRRGAAPSDAEALTQSIRSDPDLEATEPVAVSVGGIDAVQMDVTAAPGASVCQDWPAPLVLAPGDGTGATLEKGSRTRLYLLDAPEGSSIRTLAIAINAPERDFEHLMEAAAPVVDSFEFHAP